MHRRSTRAVSYLLSRVILHPRTGNTGALNYSVREAATHMLPVARVGGAVLMLAANPGNTVPSSDVNRTVRAAKQAPHNKTRDSE